MNTDSLYEHYCDTNEKISEKIKERNKFFIFLFIPIIFLIFLSPSFDSFRKLFVQFFFNNYKIDIENNLEIIELILWIGLLYFSTRYYQANIYIERTYLYVTNLENKLKEEYGKYIFRESKAYLDSYPLISSVIDKIYKYFFPFLYIGFLVYKMSTLIFSNITLSIRIIDFIIGFFCYLLIILYLFFVFDIDEIYNKENEINTNRG